MDLPDSGIEPGSPELQVDSLPTALSGKPGSPFTHHQMARFYSLSRVIMIEGAQWPGRAAGTGRGDLTVLAPNPRLLTPMGLGCMLTLCAPPGPREEDGQLRLLPGQVPGCALQT